MKKVNHLTLAALALLSLAGCTHDEEPAANGLPMTGTPLRATAEITAPVTREAMTTQDLTHYYFRVTDQDGAATTEYDYFTSMTLANGQWTGDKAMTWGTAYPKVSALEQKGVEWNQTEYTTGKTIAVQTNQSDRETGLLKSDLLYMAPKAISTADLDAEGNIKVNLAHRFAKLKVVVNVTGATANPITALTIGGTQTTATFIPETDVLTLSGNVADIIPYRESTEASTSGPGYTTTYECILLPQQLAANTLKVTATAGEDGTTKSYEHPKELELKGNTQYTLKLTMNHQGAMNPSGDVNVGNWGDEGEIEGGEISEDGKTYTVSTATSLLEWAQAAAQGQSPNLILTDDIDMTGQTWPTIENYTGGTIDGGGHTISNLTLTKQNTVDIGLIASYANECTIKNLTLLNPCIRDEFAYTSAFFVGDRATNITMENCHVIGGIREISGSSNYEGGLVCDADYSKFIACSITSTQDMNLMGQSMRDINITACYTIGGNLVGYEWGGTSPAYNASYYLNNNVITAADGSTVDDWSEAAEKMNEALSGKGYQWVVNTGENATDRPLVIKTQTTE